MFYVVIMLRRNMKLVVFDNDNDDDNYDYKNNNNDDLYNKIASSSWSSPLSTTENPTFCQTVKVKESDNT